MRRFVAPMVVVSFVVWVMAWPSISAADPGRRVPLPASTETGSTNSRALWGQTNVSNGTITVRSGQAGQTRQPVIDQRTGAPRPVPTQAATRCVETPTNPCVPIGWGPIAPASPGPDIAAAARQAVAALSVPAPTPQIGPDPNLNEWKIVAVGYPIWIWTDHPDQLATTVTSQGITITIVAQRTSTRFDLGDGTIRICTTMSRYPGPMNPPKPSPDCGHTYLKLPKTPGSYTITATATWQATWTAQGLAGTATLTASATRDVPIGELQSVLVPRR